MPDDRQRVFPTATYRVQFTPQFGFDDAAAIAQYLARLGISHLYASPYFQARAGSAHGYDVVDHQRLNRQLGGSDGFARMCKALADNQLGQVLDIVPNHEAIGQANPMWWDVLTHGRASRFAEFFDINWQSPEPKNRNKVLQPVLGDHYGRVLAAGEVKLRREGARFTVEYFEHRFPIDPATLDLVLAPAGEQAGDDSLLVLARALRRLPRRRDPASIDLRHRTAVVLLELLARALAEQADLAAAVDHAVEQINASPDRLDALLHRQHYRLAHWRLNASEINYRRFFAIDQLAGLRVEDRTVFDAVHVRIAEWIARGLLDGLRVDHPDGLRDPKQYLDRLRKLAPAQWIVVEKILQPDEALPPDWPVDGTTGYDFLNQVNGLFVDPAGEEPITRFYREFTGESDDWPEIVRQCKLKALAEMFGGEVNRLAALLVAITFRYRDYRDFSRRQLRDAVVELAASMPVYRSYVRPRVAPAGEQDAEVVGQAVAAAAAHRPDLPAALWELLRWLLLGEAPGELETDFVMRFQQLASPAMAKGVEDTAFYRFNRLVSLNEVGGDPGRFGVRPAEFHTWCEQTHRRWPRTMLATSTHDTKRSEDTRLRIDLLSEMPDDWAHAVRRWSEHNQQYRQGDWPDRNSEYLLYQTMVGAWPISADRLTDYMLKAAHEAKQHTSWTDPDGPFEDALRSFIAGVCGDNAFVGDLEAFVAPLAPLARISSLSQTLLKLTAPGVPDFYQGCELWNHTLVDPDNRQPVDYQACRRLANELEGAHLDDVLARMREGGPKLFCIQRVLALRHRHPDWFGEKADYRAMEARGEKAEHVVVFGRGDDLIVIAPRLLVGLNGEWGHTAVSLPDGTWANLFTHERMVRRVHMREVLAKFPVALLVRRD